MICELLRRSTSRFVRSLNCSRPDVCDRRIFKRETLQTCEASEMLQTRTQHLCVIEIKPRKVFEAGDVLKAVVRDPRVHEPEVFEARETAQVL